MVSPAPMHPYLFGPWPCSWPCCWPLPLSKWARGTSESPVIVGFFAPCSPRSLYDIAGARGTTKALAIIGFSGSGSPRPLGDSPTNTRDFWTRGTSYHPVITREKSQFPAIQGGSITHLQIAYSLLEVCFKMLQHYRYVHAVSIRLYQDRGEPAKKASDSAGLSGSPRFSGVLARKREVGA